MLDAYNVGNCDAMVGDTTELAALRLSNGVNHLRSRMLDSPLALTPVFVVTPVKDGTFAGLICWILQALLAADASTLSQPPAVLPLKSLRPNWLVDVQQRLGSYGAMRERNIGRDSRFDLPAWPNAPWPQGLLSINPLQ
jgi:hypothetical protein